MRIQRELMAPVGTTHLPTLPGQDEAIWSGEREPCRSRSRLTTDPLKYAKQVEQHFRIFQVSRMMGVSHQTATRIFEDLPGVKVHGDRTGSKRKRRYRTLLIPESVLKDQLGRME
jgi:hypothetical protein